MKKKSFSFETASLTNAGMVRRTNEDSLFATNQQASGKSWFNSVGLYIVADGMGGHQGGEIASEIAAQIVSKTLLYNLTLTGKFYDPLLLMNEAIEKANKEIYKMAETRQELRSMGTTITMGLRLDNELYIGHVGDSRAYLIRGQKITQITKDHSLIAQLLKQGVITPEEARIHPERGKILRCLGVSGKVRVDSHYQNSEKTKLILENNDCLVFCSDGLTTYVTDNEILTYVTKHQKVTDVCKGLIDLANCKGGGDNISVIVVRVKTDLNNISVSKRV
jgi:serine/threonine protein phosphatase PrpC